MPHPSITTRPCPVCGAECEVRRTARGKPYWHCDDCIVQVFVRGQVGIERFNQGRPSRTPGEEFWS